MASSAFRLYVIKKFLGGHSGHPSGVGFCQPWLQPFLAGLGAAVRDGDPELEALKPAHQAAAWATALVAAALHAEADVLPTLWPFHPCVLLDWHNGLVGRQRWRHPLAKGRLAGVCLRLRLPEGLAPATAGRAERG